MAKITFYKAVIWTYWIQGGGAEATTCYCRYKQLRCMRGNDGTYIWFASKWGMVAVDAPCNVTPIEVSEKMIKVYIF